MTTAKLLLEKLQENDDDVVNITYGTYHLRLVPGRAGSVCFALHQDAGIGIRKILAEGFSEHDELIYHQQLASHAEIDAVIHRILRPRMPHMAEHGRVAAALIAADH